MMDFSARTMSDNTWQPTVDSRPFNAVTQVPNLIKMIIWDLDDTFWRGTLAEGGISFLQENLEIVKALCSRGIVSSICSKNNHVDAQRVLEQHSAWSYFVFPRIEFTAKGAAVAAIIDHANLRPDNVLFIDDNQLNLEEARHYVPTVMTARPEDILPLLLDLPQAKGKQDPNFTRLHQYKQLEQKASDQAVTSLGNQDFLRSCNVRVKIAIDVESHFDRVVELINRSNQLNFTKVRVETPEAVAAFRKALGEFGIHAGVVSASDKYGDYGIIGFFMVKRRAASQHLKHFVFSCRTMNMGIEQYVYELLGEPTCKIVPPVANGLKAFDKVDWIQPSDQDGWASTGVSDEKLVLLGGCDLMQVATYCSTRRVEYVNKVARGVQIRYDDPGFILSSREAIAASDLLPTIPCWSKEDAVRFDADLSDARTVIVSLWEMLNGDYMLLGDELMIRLGPRLRTYIDGNLDAPCRRQCTFIRLTIAQKLELVVRSLDRIAQLSPTAHARFLLGINVAGITQGVERRNAYNKAAADYCERSRAFEYVAIDDVVPKEELLDGIHLTRKGYFALASKMIERMKTGAPPAYASRDIQTGFGDVTQKAKILNPT
jgi:FkbH-like protein